MGWETRIAGLTVSFSPNTLANVRGKIQLMLRVINEHLKLQSLPHDKRAELRGAKDMAQTILSLLDRTEGTADERMGSTTE